MTTKATKTLALSEVSPQLMELVRLAQEGTEIVITSDGQPVARLVSAGSSDQPRLPGLDAGKAWISDDFDAELPDEFWLGKE